MAKAAISEETASTSQARLPVAKLLIVVMLGSGLGVAATGGGLYYMIKSGRLSLTTLTGISGAGGTGEPGTGAGHPLVLEPMLVNLADESGHAYLRLSLTLDLEGLAAREEAGSETKPAKTPSEEELAVRDTVLAVLGRQTSVWLLGPDGKEHLKIELKEALAKQNAPIKVKDVFFTDFLVQI